MAKSDNVQKNHASANRSVIDVLCDIVRQSSEKQDVENGQESVVSEDESSRVLSSK